MAQKSDFESDLPSVVVQQLEALRSEIARQENTVRALYAAGHETQDALKRLNLLRTILAELEPNRVATKQCRRLGDDYRVKAAEFKAKAKITKDPAAQTEYAEISTAYSHLAEYADSLRNAGRAKA